jgi:maleylacetoacetate isomerase
MQPSQDISVAKEFGDAPMTNTILLYDYWRSSASYRVRIGLNLLGLPYESRAVDLVKGEQSSADHLGLNPQGLVPVLQIDGKRFTQSLAILEYLDETRQAGFLPKHAADRQRVRSLAYAIAMEIHPVCNLRVAKHAVSLGGTATTEGWMQHFIALGLTGFEGLLTEREATPFCCGETVTMADICLVPQIYNARRWNVSLAPFARTIAIAERLEKIPAFVSASPESVKP